MSVFFFFFNFSQALSHSSPKAACVMEILFSRHFRAVSAGYSYWLDDELGISYDWLIILTLPPAATFPALYTVTIGLASLLKFCFNFENDSNLFGSLFRLDSSLYMQYDCPFQEIALFSELAKSQNENKSPIHDLKQHVHFGSVFTLL